MRQIYSKSIIIVISCLIGLVITKCGYTKLSTKNDSTDVANNYNGYTFNGQWTKREDGTSGGDAWILDYYLLFVSDSHSGGRYGVGFDRSPKVSGNYFISGDTLTFLSDYYVQKFSYDFRGESLILNLISLERFDKEKYPLRIEGMWRRTY